MSVTVDQNPLAADELGLKTVGQVLAHLQRDNRLVVHVLIDGREPDIEHMSAVRQSPILDHTVYIETADPREMALDVLSAVESQLAEADRLRVDASELLQKNQTMKALEKLSGCFSTWQHGQESILKTAQLLRIDLNHVHVGPQALTELLQEFTRQLREIKSALENRDFILLNDILTYETNQTSAQWKLALRSMREAIGVVGNKL